MMLNALDLQNASIGNIKVVKKLTVYEYLWTDTNAVEEAGLGVRSLVVTGIAESAATRDAIEQACEAAGVKHLYFPSAQGQSDDRYYHVYTQPAALEPITASMYRYTIECICADPRVYVTSTNLVVW